MDEELLPVHIKPSTPLYEVQKADLAGVQSVLSMCKDAAAIAESVDDICKVALTTLKALEFRRKALNLPFGAEAKQSQLPFLTPYEE